MKLKLLLFIGSLLLMYSSLSAKDYYLATDGDNKNPGTLEKPFASLEYAVQMLGPGDVCFIRGGEYFPASTVDIYNSGTKDARIKLFAYENEKPVFNFKALPYDDNSRGIYHRIGANYWHYKGITICNAGDNGMKMEGSFCVIEQCTFRDNKDTGLQLGFGKGSKGENTRNPDYYYGRYNIILNCDSYNNYDTNSGGGNADGFAVKLYPGPGNEFHGCRSWYNSDDGWDLYYVHFPVVINNCWTMKNGYDKGNGNGFKMGGGSQGEEMSDGAHILTNCISTDNLKKGFDQNNHNEGSYMINCVSVRNGVNYGFNNDAPAYGQWTLRNNIGFLANERNHQFNASSIVDAENCSWITFDGCDKYSDRNKVPDPNKPGGTITPKIGDYTSEFTSITYEDAIADRQEDGSLPAKFGRLKAGSKFIDAGTIITNFDAADVKYPKYGKIVNIPYFGTSADMGAFEYGIDKNEYELVMPENDGSVPEEIPIDPNEEWIDDDGNIYEELVLADWYPFQDAALPDSLKFITGGSIDLAYAGDEANGLTPGALKLAKSGAVELTLPSLRRLEAKLYFTGDRVITVKYKLQGVSQWTEKSVSKSKGSHTINLAAMAIKTKSPITIQIENSRAEGGDMRISDIFVSGYKLKNIVSIENNVAENETDIYQTETSIIAYGEISTMQIYGVSGNKVASSNKTQVVDISALSKGMYILVIKTNEGKTITKKFIK